MPSMLRSLPSVGELLESPPLKSLVSRVSHNVVVSKVGQFLDDLRGQVHGATGVNIPSPAELAERIARWIAASERAALRPVINATGVLLHCQLGGPPLADEALRAMTDVGSGYASANVDLATGQSTERSAAVSRLLARLSGAEAAVVVNSPAVGGWIALCALAARREVLVSRGQIAETGGIRLPDLAATAGATLREVGTTNQTRIADFAAAAGEAAALLLRAEPTSYVLAGDVEQPSLADLVGLGRRRNLSVIHELGVGALIGHAAYGTIPQVTAKESVQTGIDLVLVAGDRLLGGPPCGILLGTESVMQRILAHPLLPALEADPCTLSALAATLRLYEDDALAERSIPLLTMLATDAQNLKNRAERLAPQIIATGMATAEVREGETTLTGADLPGQRLKTVGLWLTPINRTAEALAAALRWGTPAVVGRVEEGRVVLDLRSVPPRSDVPLMTAFESLARGAAAPGEIPVVGTS